MDCGWIREVSRSIDIPFCVAGGIKTVEDARQILEAGAEKISINSPALADPDLITEMAKEFGTQCIVVGIDSWLNEDQYTVYKFTGVESAMRSSGRRTLDWAKEAQERGAGEIVLNCMNRDGVSEGYDVHQLFAIRQVISIPLVASGGAGNNRDFKIVFEKAHVDAALAASVFHYGKLCIGDLKKYLIAEKICIRPFLKV